jgi:hypothetical protein
MPISATAPPVAAPLDDDERDLFGKRSVIGALAVVVCLTIFGVGLQAVDEMVRNSDGFTTGQPQAVSETVSFTPASGWINDPAQTVPGSAVVAQKNGWDFKIATGIVLQPDQTLEDFAQIFYEIPPGEVGALVTDAETFTTSSGLHGVTWETHGTTRAEVKWLIANGDQVTQILLDGPASTFDSVKSEVEDMAASVTMAGSAGA